jgi:hypothetical protein
MGRDQVEITIGGFGHASFSNKIHHHEDFEQTHFVYRSEAPCFGPIVEMSDIEQTVVLHAFAAEKQGLKKMDAWACEFSPKTHLVTAEVALAEPLDASRPFPNSHFFKDRVVLVQRGNVPLRTKIKYAQDAGALGVIIADTGLCKRFDQNCVPGGDKARGEGFAALDSKEVWSNIHIPAVLIHQDDAAVLLKYLLPEEDKEL